MTWFKVDDKLHDHRKARAAGAAAMGVWVLAGSWAADNLTDGFIPATILPRWGRPRDATRLVDVGLWFADKQDGEEGWRFHEWHERQPTRAQRLEERAAKVEAGRAGGIASGATRRQKGRNSGGVLAAARRNSSEFEPESGQAGAATQPANSLSLLVDGGVGQANAKQNASGLVEPPTRPEPDPTIDADASTSRELALHDAPTRLDVRRLCDHLAQRIHDNGVNPKPGKKWHDAARLMLDRDGRTEQQVHAAIDWCQDDEFWRSNILSMPKLREKYDQLSLQAQRRPASTRASRNDIDWEAAFARAAAKDQAQGELT